MYLVSNPTLENYLTTFIFQAMQQSLLLCMGFKNYFCNISIHRQKKNCLAYWNLQTWSLQTEGKIIPTACLTRRPVHLPNFKNMEMNVIDRLAPIWTFIHHRLIALLQAQISSTFLANNHQMPKKTFIIIIYCRNLGYTFLGYHQKLLVLPGICNRKQDTVAGQGKGRGAYYYLLIEV